jgi:hypothetical protein
MILIFIKLGSIPNLIKKCRMSKMLWFKVLISVSCKRSEAFLVMETGATARGVMEPPAAAALDIKV